MSTLHTLSMLIACTALLASTALSQTTPPNTLLNHDGTSFLQNEEQLWISRADSLFVIADWRDWRLGFRRIGFAVSTDGGATWGVDSLAVGTEIRQSDPCMTGDRLGAFYMNALDYEPGGNSYISVWRSTDHGASWGAPVHTAPAGPWFEDKQFTTVDRTGGMHDGNYYMSWTRFPNTTPAVINFVRSTNSAQTFLSPRTVGPVITSSCGTFSQGQGSIPVVNADGSVHVFWSGYDIDSSCSIPLSRSFAIRHAYSTNGGFTFTPDEAVFSSNAYFEAIDGGVDVYGFPIADADLSGGPYDGTIYIAHTQYVSGFSGETDIQIRKSTDNGLTWTAPAVVNDDPPGNNIDQFHPWLTVNQDGALTMVFYDQRTDPVGHRKFDCFFTASFDGAETFITNYRVSEVSIDPSALASASLRAATQPAIDWEDPGDEPTSAVMAGLIAEYIAVHAFHDQVVAVWTDTRHGNQDAFAARFDIPFLKPRLYLPKDSTVTKDSLPTFMWSTCWHETEDSYRLELSRNAAFSSLEYEFAGLTDHEFVPPSPLATGPYFWRVKAFRTEGDSTEYSDVYFLDAHCATATAPVGLAPGPADTMDVATFDLTWSEVGDALTYRVQLDADGSYTSPLIDSSLADTLVTMSGLPDSSDYFWRVNATDDCGTGDWAESEFRLAVCPIGVTGDVNVDGVVTSADIIALIDFVFKSGSPPLPVVEAGDVDCDGAVDSGDIIYLVNYVFKGGTPPCDACTLL